MKNRNLIIAIAGGFILLFSQYACSPNKTVPFPENASGYKVPVQRSFEYPESTPIVWHEVGKDSLPEVSMHPFRLNNLSSKIFTVNSFKPEKEPVTEIPLNWDELPRISFNLDTVKKDTFQVRAFLLPEPEITKVNPPYQYTRSTTGILQIGAEEGLPGNYIYEVIHDKNGTIWISTERGLVCYKGAFFELYDFMPPLDNTNKDVVTDIAVDHDNNLWLTTWGGKIFKVNPKTGIVQAPLLDETFARIEVDKQGKLWVSNHRKGVSVIHMDYRTIQTFYLKGIPEGNPNYFGVKLDKEDNIWIGNRKNVYVVNPAQNAYRMLDVNVGLDITFAHSFMETKAGDMWINSFSSGAYSISANKKLIQVINEKQGFNGSSISVCEDPTGKIWIIDNDTIFIHDPKKLEYKKIINGLKMYVQGANPATSLIDQNGNLWLGTPQNKMLIIDPMGGLPEHLDMSDGLISNDVWGMVEDKDGLLWLGTHNGLNIYDREKDKIMEFTTDNGLSHNRRIQVNLMDDGRVIAGGALGFSIFDKKRRQMAEYKMPVLVGSNMEEGETGKLWFGSIDGLYLLDTKTLHMQLLTHYKDTPIGRIWGMQKDEDGKLWIISNSNTYVVDMELQTILPMWKKEGIVQDYVTAIFKTHTGELWIGGNPGFSIVNTEKHTIQTITAQQGLYPETMYDLAELNGKMYIGSQDGIVMCEPPKPSDALPLWDFYNYSKRDGFTLNDYNQGAAMTTQSGEIWWGVTPQITILTQAPRIDHKKPKVFISGITIMDQKPEFYKKVDYNAIFEQVDTLWNYQFDDYLLKSSIPEDSGYYIAHNIQWDSISILYNLPVGLKLPYHQNSVSFSFANPDIKGRDKIAYRYVLEGEDKVWSRISTDPFSRNYYNLQHGQYTFKVATRGFNGEWSDFDQFDFTILPPWWLTTPAYIAYLVIIIGLAFIIDRFQRRRLLKRERDRAREKELEQAREIEKAYKNLEIAHEHLKATQAQLIQSEKMASLGELTAGIAHEIQNPLNFVNNFSEVNKELITEMREELEGNNLDEVKSIADDIEANEMKIITHGKRAEAIVKSMLLHSRGNNTQKEPTDLNALADEYLRLSYHGLRAKDKSFNADFNLESVEDLPVIDVVPQDIGRVMLNLINNAFYAVTAKASGKSDANFKPMVTVVLKKLNHKVEISIHDNGDGIPANVKEKIFQPFFTTKPTGSGTGLGLSLSYDIIKAHGGDLTFSSEPGEGTTFSITLNTP